MGGGEIVKRKRKVMPLTSKQRKVLDFIIAYNQKRQTMPTIREINAHIGVKSTSTGAYHIERLVAKGYLRRDKFKSRSLYIVNRNAPWVTFLKTL